MGKNGQIFKNTMTIKHRKRCSTPLVIWEMQLNDSMKLVQWVKLSPEHSHTRVLFAQREREKERDGASKERRNEYEWSSKNLK